MAAGFSNQRRGGSFVAGNFNRLAQTFPLQGAGTATLERPWGAPTDGTADGPPGYGAPPGPIPPGAVPPASAAPFLASETFNKVAVLTAIALGAGLVSFVLPVSAGLAMGSLLVAFALAIWTTFRPRMARRLAPLYAGFEGFALGVVSRFYNETSHGIVPLAVVFTGAVFLATLLAYRTGLVKVTKRFITATIVLTFGIMAVFIASILGVPVPGVSSGSNTQYVIFGVLFLVISVMNLMVDFELVNRAQAAAVSAEGEWYAAFSIMLSLVMVYLSLLRILGGSRR